MSRAKTTSRRAKSGKERGPAKRVRTAKTKPAPDRAAGTDPQLVVGIGASAGGLQAFKTFFGKMPTDSGMAFVLVQHLAPQHRSLLAELIQSSTSMEVVEVRNGMPLAANHVYVIPPNATLTVRGGRLQVTKPAPERAHRRPVDSLFTSLAEDQQERAVCIILSGGGSDGAEGVGAIKEHGGLTMAQAEFDEHAEPGMPSSAAATGFVDHVLAIKDMPAKLVAYAEHLRSVEPRKGPDGTREDTAQHLGRICTVLRKSVGHDFSQYKTKTLVRRVQRRMQVLQIDSTPAYLSYLNVEPKEAGLLLREFLIGVTRFFRDPPAFDALAGKAIAELVLGRGAGKTVRVWVPACSTGEEVYSIAILLREATDKLTAKPDFQIFATDIDENAITTARAARYPLASFDGMSAARRERWFGAVGEQFSPIKEIREMCIFSVHSVIKDPPFSKLDLISCRNLMIYLEGPAQDRAMRIFHYALQPGGFLFLGSSENVTRHSKLFGAVDQKARIFRRRDVAATLPDHLSGLGPEVAGRGTVPQLLANGNGVEKSVRRLMERHVPAYVVVDANHDILRFSGATEKYLGPSPGAASLNLFTLIRRSLRPAARTALAKAIATGESVRHDALPMDVNGEGQMVDLAVEPVPDSEPGLCIVAFIDRKPDAAGKPSTEQAQARPLAALEKELKITRERLEATVDQLETSNEEMKSANEEYQSVNEELQSTNEELETSKEELQSINEELQTVNAELNSKNSTLVHLNSDLQNLLDSTQIATLFLDSESRIRNFTPPLSGILHVRESDIGRPVTDIASRLSYDQIVEDANEVMRDLSVVEREVTIKGGATYLMRLRPYRTINNVISGTVVTFVDITDRKHSDDIRLHMIDELNHRVKNTLATVQAIANQSFRGTTDARNLQVFEARLVSLSRTHGLLARQSWQSVPLRELAEQELNPYRREDIANVAIEGPELSIKPTATLALGLVLHEMATNAAKYGALTNGSGKVRIAWDILHALESDSLRLIWAESGGPPVTAPARKGFGSKVIERGLSAELGGQVKIDYPAGGILYTILLPLAAIEAPGKESRRGS
jgi:two-component system CheB/CheR fusion protein